MTKTFTRCGDGCGGFRDENGTYHELPFDFDTARQRIADGWSIEDEVTRQMGPWNASSAAMQNIVKTLLDG